MRRFDVAAAARRLPHGWRVMAALAGIALLAVLLLQLAFAWLGLRSGRRDAVRIGSKAFTESVILAEIASQQLERQGIAVQRRFYLGSTRICFAALQHGAIDLYPEYSGTAWWAILHRAPPTGSVATQWQALRRLSASELNVRWLSPLGFANTYALAMPRRRAAELGIASIAGLRQHHGLRVGFAAEFVARQDGWPGLQRHYGLHFLPPVRAMEAGLTLRAAAEGKLDVISVYATDGRLLKADLRLLGDDWRFFPAYEAAFLTRGRGLPARARAALEQLQGRISLRAMQAMNLKVDGGEQTAAQAAAGFLRDMDRVSPSRQAAAADAVPRSRSYAAASSR